MYLGIDIGGTKILMGVLSDSGEISQSAKHPTPDRYEDALEVIKKQIEDFGVDDYRAAAVGIPAAHLDRRHGVGIDFGNLSWRNTPIARDVERLAKCPVVVENDAKLATLSEAMLRKKYDKVLYITLSTGIGVGLTVNRKIDTNLSDAGGKTMLIPHKGQMVSWESIASGRAIVDRYGKPASEINDTATWQKIVRELVPGFLELIAVTEPDVIVVGGSVGRYFDKYGALLRTELQKHETPLMPIPPIEGALRPEEAVLFGCYDIAKEVYGHRHR